MVDQPLQLRDSQRVALEMLIHPDRHFGALWAEPRSGKTAVTLRWLQHLMPKVALVVGPKIAEGTWRSEAAKWLEVPYRFFSLTSGNKYPDLNHQFKGITLFFVNYDQFGKAPYTRLKPYIDQIMKYSYTKGGNASAMILDESHMIKTPSSVTGRNIRPWGKRFWYRLLITGTPVTNPNQIDAVYGQWTFLDPSIRDKWPTARDFREYFGEWTNVKGFPELIRPIRQYELNQYIQPHVVTMSGAANPVPVKRVNYTVPDQVLKDSKHLLKHGVVDMPGHTVAALNPLTRLLRLRQLAAGWCTDDNDMEFTIPAAASKRINVLHKVLRRTKGKSIIACTHLHEVRMVAKSLRKRGIDYLVITGETKDKDNVIREFQAAGGQVLLVQPRTVAMAVDISVANDLIWYSSDFNYVTFKQTSDRIKLSPANPTVWFLSGKGTVDEDVWTTLVKDHKHLRKTIARINDSRRVRQQT